MGHCSRIGMYQFKPGTCDANIKLAKDGLLPLFQKQPGFISYFVSKGPADKGYSVSVWESRDYAERAGKVAADWNQQHTEKDTLSAEVVLADVGFGVEAPTPTEAGAGLSTVVRDLFAACNEKKLDRIAGLVTTGAKATNTTFGREFPIRDALQQWATAFPDGQIEIKNLVQAGNCVVAELIGRGTHTGVFEGPTGKIAPTHQHVELRLIDVFDLQNGKISGMRSYFDSSTLFKQLGLLPEIPLAAAKAPAPATQPPRH